MNQLKVLRRLRNLIESGRITGALNLLNREIAILAKEPDALKSEVEPEEEGRIPQPYAGGYDPKA